MTVVHEVIAAGLATMQREVDAPLPPFGYGTDLSCVSDLTEDYAEVDPNSKRAIAEAVVRRLTCPRGALLDDQDYGTDLRGMANRGVEMSKIRELGATVRAEARKDDRVLEASVQVTYAQNVLSVAMMITPADAALGTFELTFSVSDTQALIESIGL